MMPFAIHPTKARRVVCVVIVPGLIVEGVTTLNGTGPDVVLNEISLLDSSSATYELAATMPAARRRGGPTLLGHFADQFESSKKFIVHPTGSDTVEGTNEVQVTRRYLR